MRREPTPAEKALWDLVRAGRLGVRFRRQEQIDRFIVDLACLAQRIVVEIDGDRHASDLRGRLDADRDAALERLGFRVLRFSESDVRDDPVGVAEDIWACLAGNRRVPSVFEFAQLDS